VTSAALPWGKCCGSAQSCPGGLLRQRGLGALLRQPAAEVTPTQFGFSEKESTKKKNK